LASFRFFVHSCLVRHRDNGASCAFFKTLAMSLELVFFPQHSVAEESRHKFLF
jgi:hypothetical protein